MNQSNYFRKMLEFLRESLRDYEKNVFLMF